MKKLTCCIMTLAMLFCLVTSTYATSTPYFNKSGMTADEIIESYGGGENRIIGGNVDYYFDSLQEMTEFLEEHLEFFERNIGWVVNTARHAELTYYLREHFWLPVGYAEDDIICIKILQRGEMEVIFSDRRWLSYEYTKTIDSSEFDDYADMIGETYGEWGDSIIFFVEPTVFTLYESGIGYNDPESVERHEVDVYNLHAAESTVIPVPQEGKYAK